MSQADIASTYKAQFGEDRILEQHFHGKRDGFYVEVGAFNGEEMSNTFHFEQIGWEGILVEADPELAEKCRAARPRATVVNCAVVAPDAPPEVTFRVSEDKSLSSLSFSASRQKFIEGLYNEFNVSEITVPGRTLDSILAEQGVGRIDFMTIDVEGHEWGVLRGFTIAKWKPEVVLIERNMFFPESRIVRYMYRNGYHYLRTTGVNDWFEHRPGKPIRSIGNIARFSSQFYISRPVAHISRPLVEATRHVKWNMKKIARPILAGLGLLGPAKRLRDRIRGSDRAK